MHAKRKNGDIIRGEGYGCQDIFWDGGWVWCGRGRFLLEYRAKKNITKVVDIGCEMWDNTRA